MEHATSREYCKTGLLPLRGVSSKIAIFMKRSGIYHIYITETRKRLCTFYLHTSKSIFFCLCVYRKKKK